MLKVLGIVGCCGCEFCGTETCGVLNVFSESRVVEEIIELHTSVGSTVTLCRTKLSCPFVTPVVEFSEESINFRVEMVNVTVCAVCVYCPVCSSA